MDSKYFVIWWDTSTNPNFPYMLYFFLVFISIGPAFLFYLQRKLSRLRASSTGFYEKVPIPLLQVLRFFFGNFLISLINNFTKVHKNRWSPLAFTGCQPIIISLINHDSAAQQQQCIYSNIEIKNAFNLSVILMWRWPTITYTR